MPYNVDKRVLTTICQKCPAPATKTPMVDFKLPNGLLWIPDFLWCPQCGNYVTIHVRDMTEEELKEREILEIKPNSSEQIKGGVTETPGVELLVEAAGPIPQGLTHPPLGTIPGLPKEKSDLAEDVTCDSTTQES